MSTEFATGIAKGEDSFGVGKEAANQAMNKISGKANGCIVFSSSKYKYEEVIRGIRKVTDNAPLIGCSDAGEFTEKRVEKGSVACGVISSDTYKFHLGIGIGEGLSRNPLNCVQSTVQQIQISPKEIGEFPHRSAIMLLDGLAGTGEEAVLAANMIFGGNTKLVGGAAGDDLKFKQTKVIVNERVKSDTVGLGLIQSKSPLSIGLKHGHHPISPPLEVTKVSENRVYELDNRPAWEVWKEYREEAEKLGIDTSDPKNFMLRCPAGIQVGSEYKIRWPIALPKKDGSLSFACSIPKRTVFRITASTKEDEIKSARLAAESALSRAKDKEIAGAIIFDCACRGIILGEEFSKSIEGIKSALGDIPLVGFETYGEVAMDIGLLSGFHNTTTVVTLFPK
jgi:methyl-accepting chemotaxis protein